MGVKTAFSGTDVWKIPISIETKVSDPEPEIESEVRHSGEVTIKEAPLAPSTCESSFSEGIEYTYLVGHACESKGFRDLSSARQACCGCQECAGVTHNTESNSYTMRKGQILKPSHIENSYLKDAMAL
eukprot:TRINITY_DN2969_c0_g1_i1.p1 TRINITY_DN2969_c0_g1~~TRINITY_DN2969_c0_g1_i1.p1  ORF type:complete len:128 (-),score=12.80 TRINITY_DN2969_c0_g1_i1:334-717(-)